MEGTAIFRLLTSVLMVAPLLTGLTTSLDLETGSNPSETVHLLNKIERGESSDDVFPAGAANPSDRLDGKHASSRYDRMVLPTGNHVIFPDNNGHMKRIKSSTKRGWESIIMEKPRLLLRSAKRQRAILSRMLNSRFRNNVGKRTVQQVIHVPIHDDEVNNVYNALTQGHNNQKRMREEVVNIPSQQSDDGVWMWDDVGYTYDGTDGNNKPYTVVQTNPLKQRTDIENDIGRIDHTKQVHRVVHKLDGLLRKRTSDPFNVNTVGASYQPLEDDDEQQSDTTLNINTDNDEGTDWKCVKVYGDRGLGKRAWEDFVFGKRGWNTADQYTWVCGVEGTGRDGVKRGWEDFGKRRWSVAVQSDKERNAVNKRGWEDLSIGTHSKFINGWGIPNMMRFATKREVYQRHKREALMRRCPCNDGHVQYAICPDCR